MIRRRFAALMLSLVMMLTMMPLASLDAFAAEEGSGDEVLQEIARQMQDEDADPFAFRGKDGKLRAQSDTDSSFDLRDVDGNSYVTPVKFQNPFGTCWGFSAIAAAETSILGNGTIRGEYTSKTMDLSEKHLAWFTFQPIKDESNPQYGEGGYFTGEGSDILNIGGYPFYGTSLFAGGAGPVLEELNSRLEYHGKNKEIMYKDNVEYCYSPNDDWSLPDSYRFKQSFRLKESYILPTPAKKTGTERTAAINAIKQQLEKKRAVAIGYCADTSRPEESGTPKETKYISQNWAHYTYDTGRANHAVAIVGWDDNYPKKNFQHKIKDMSDADAYALSTPEHDGAWLVKNSWGDYRQQFPNKGPGWGLYEGQDKAPYQKTGDEAQQTGYFWLSYDDKSVMMVEALDFDLSNVDNEYLVYQHDYMPVNDVDSAYLSGKTSMANVFTAELPSRIEQVTCETTAPGTMVHYEVYFLKDGAKDPVDGTKVAEMDNVYTYGGFHKEDLPEPVTAATGQKFSVVVTQKTPDKLYSINMQTAWNKTDLDEYNREHPDNKVYNYSKGVINEGESLFMAGGKWYDLSEEWIQDMMEGEDCRLLDMDNFAIKVYVTEGEEPEPPADRSQQMGADGTPFGRGASAEAAEAAALAWRSDGDPAGTVFAPLLLRSSSQGKNTETLRWAQQNGASSYVIYGAASGKSNALRKIASVNSNSFTVNGIAGAALKKGTYYKFLIVALDSSDNVVASSKMIHAATKGGKVRNYSKVKVRKPRKAKLSLKAGKAYKIKARATGSRVKKKRGLRYESTAPAVASVTSKGRIRAVSAGSCSIRVYAQNGAYKTIKVRVR